MLDAGTNDMSLSPAIPCATRPACQTETGERRYPGKYLERIPVLRRKLTMCPAESQHYYYTAMKVTHGILTQPSNAQ